MAPGVRSLTEAYSASCVASFHPHDCRSGGSAAMKFMWFGDDGWAPLVDGFF